MDDSRTLASAAAAATEIDEDFYFDDDGFSSQQLGDGPWPPLELRPQGTAAQRLQVLMGRASATLPSGSPWLNSPLAVGGSSTLP